MVRGSTAWPLYENDETLPITMSFGTCASRVIRVSAMPSARYSFAGSEDRLENGSTATEAAAFRSDWRGAGSRTDLAASSAVDSVERWYTQSPAPPASKQQRQDRDLGA
jgi:hypothetical protein